MPPHREPPLLQVKNTKSDKSSIERMKCSVGEITIPRKMNPRDLYSMNTPEKPQIIREDNTALMQNSQGLISEAQSEWLLDLCCSLQESALKALRISNEKYEATIEQLRQQAALDEVHQRNHVILDHHSRRQTPEMTSTERPTYHRNIPYASDLPPKPPPRQSPSQPPPLPPPPSSHLRWKMQTNALPCKYPQPATQPSIQQVLYNMQSLNMHRSSVAESQYQNKGIYDYRHSPSSGFYSCSAGSPSPSSISLELDSSSAVTSGMGAQPSPSPLITQFVKSIQVEKPQLQTASAPPPYTREPPSYVSAMQQRDCEAEVKSPPSPPVKHHSPIPERRNKEEKDCKVKNYSPQAFKFFMEQHVENVLKSYKQRVFRRIQLESEMAKIGLSAEAQKQMRKMLSQKESNYIRLKRAKMDKSMFTSIKIIGVGAFGEVALVRKIDTNHLYAMKTLRKADVLKRKQVAHVKAERDILAEADNEWVVKLYYSFQDNDNLYFVMEYIPGGDLMSLLIKFGIFEEPLAKFYVAELTCAVESVHKIGFIHRDIKPDNILIDRDGHIKLTDFGLCTGFRWTHNSKYYNNDDHNRQNSLDFSDNWSNNVSCKCSHLKPLERRRRREHQRCLAHSLVGTPNYIAPEVLSRTGYTQLCDWWSVGVVLYEMLIGSPPFSADSPTETQYKIINWKNTLKIPPNCNVSPAGIDLILKLCTSPEQRLGKNVNEVKEHPFFAGIDFEKDVRKLTPPYTPTIHYLTDTSNFDPIDPESLHDSSSVTSDFSDESDGKPFHGFFEFTFRRFFDDGGGVPFPTKINTEENDSQIAIYV